MTSFFDKGTFEELNRRIDALNKNHKPQWGKMDVAQMLWHCQGPLNIILNHNDYNLKPNWLVKTFFKKTMYSDKLWRKNLPTISVFKSSESKDFENERRKLLDLVQELNTHKDRNTWQPHPVFGKLTKAQWGKMQYKHLDHHLRQFGV
ncbi:DUF1569 domain-containing protein [Ichthyenterobacterium sp. W332]|uniref:DUF1569 domain-containing protein n=1 Tax=Microcosmobacter mediterraneus TaxID=3075607 RepID=A0ABU2YMW0_9FLAO|nr:DUF1569 domain-containing protein [Ichthyenterobacterium sp. W332]MDT0558403.1 DUF1569 domain-containing protein [Ichthyenterobacterium sp. W332]